MVLFEIFYKSLPNIALEFFFEIIVTSNYNNYNYYKWKLEQSGYAIKDVNIDFNKAWKFAELKPQTKIFIYYYDWLVCWYKIMDLPFIKLYIFN